MCRKKRSAPAHRMDSAASGSAQSVAQTTWFGVVVMRDQQPKERWFSNHRLSKCGGAATKFGDSAALVGSRSPIHQPPLFPSASSVVGKPPLLGHSPLHTATPSHIAPRI